MTSEPVCQQCGALNRTTTLYHTQDGWLCVECCIDFIISDVPYTADMREDG